MNVIVMYLWREYPWTIGWSPVKELDELGGEFVLHHLFSYYGMEPPSLMSEFYERMDRCATLVKDLHEHYERKIS